MRAPKEVRIQLLLLFQLKKSLLLHVLPMMRRSSPSGMIQPPGTVGLGKLVRAHRIGDAAAHSLQLGVDRCAIEITLDPDKDWPQVEVEQAPPGRRERRRRRRPGLRE